MIKALAQAYRDRTGWVGPPSTVKLDRQPWIWSRLWPFEPGPRYQSKDCGCDVAMHVLGVLFVLWCWGIIH